MLTVNNYQKNEGARGRASVRACRAYHGTMAQWPGQAWSQACKWWHDIRHVRVWIDHHYCMSMLACQYNQPKRPGDIDLWPLTLKVVSESRVTWATSVPILVFLGLSVLDLGPMYATNRRQTASSLNVPRKYRPARSVSVGYSQDNANQ